MIFSIDVALQDGLHFVKQLGVAAGAKSANSGMAEVILATLWAWPGMDHFG
jgi:hypothetical protein